MKRLFRLVAISITWGTLVACSADSPKTAAPADAGACPVADEDLLGANNEAPPIVSLTEKAIVGIAHALHDSENEMAALAEERALDDRALAHAKMIRAEHAQSREELDKFALESEDGPVSRGIRREAALRIASLKGLTGRTFDIAYMTAEVTTQTAILGLLNAILVSNYTTPDVRSVLRQMRINAANSLREAARVQAEFYAIEGIDEPRWESL